MCVPLGADKNVASVFYNGPTHEDAGPEPQHVGSIKMVFGGTRRVVAFPFVHAHEYIRLRTGATPKPSAVVKLVKELSQAICLSLTHARTHVLPSFNYLSSFLSVFLSFLSFFRLSFCFVFVL